MYVVTMVCGVAGQKAGGDAPRLFGFAGLLFGNWGYGMVGMGTLVDE